MLEQDYFIVTDMLTNGLDIPFDDFADPFKRISVDQSKIKYFPINFIVDIFLNQLLDLAIGILNLWG